MKERILAWLILIVVGGLAIVVYLILKGKIDFDNLLVWIKDFFA